MLMLDVFVSTPTGNPFGLPSTSFSRGAALAPLGLGCAAARFARLRSASPQRGQGGWKKANLQKDSYTPGAQSNQFGPLANTEQMS